MRERTSGELLKRRALALDDIVREAWSKVERLSARADLVAVGGYGRGELHPHSDIDLLVLLSRRPVRADEERLGAFVRELWDTGLQVGHSVRSIRDATRAARNDLTVMTNYLEVRLLSGEGELLRRLDRLTATGRMWSPRRFADAKIVELRERHARFNDTAYNLEPNIKSGPGGLRRRTNGRVDCATLVWCSVTYGSHRPEPSS